MAMKIASRKKKMPSIANSTPNTSPKRPGERRPEEAELERQHGPGHGADGEGHRHRLRPAPREPQRVRVVVAQAAVVGDQHHRGQRHAERRQDDVEPQRERHLAARRREVRRKGQHRRPLPERRKHVRHLPGVLLVVQTVGRHRARSCGTGCHPQRVNARTPRQPSSDETSRPISVWPSDAGGGT